MNSQRKGDAGEFLVGEKISRLGFRWQPMPGAPFFDGEIQLFDVVPGAAIKAQVKNRDDYLVRPSGFRFYGKENEIVQWRNANAPVVLILVDDDSRKAYWQIVEDQTVTRAVKSWKIDVSFANDLDDFANARKGLIGLVTRKFVPLSLEHVRELMSRWRQHESWEAGLEIWSFIGRVAQPPVPKTVSTFSEKVETKTVVAIGLEMDPGSGQTHMPVEIPTDAFRASAGDYVGLLFAKTDRRERLLGAINLTAAYPPWTDGVSHVDRHFPESRKATLIAMGTSVAVGIGALYELHTLLAFMGGMLATTFCFLPYVRKKAARLRDAHLYLKNVLTSLREE